MFLYQLTKFQCHTFFPSQDIKQKVLISSHLGSWWHHKPYSEVSRVFLDRPVLTLKPWRCHHGWHWVGKFPKFVPPDTLKMYYLDLSVLRFPCKTFSKLPSLRYKTHPSLWIIFKKFIYSNKKLVYRAVYRFL